MELSYGYLAHSRRFDKAMFRVRKSFMPLLDDFKALNIHHTECNTILVGLVGNKPLDHFEFLGNNEGFFQLHFGICETETDQEVALSVYHILLKAVRYYPFTQEEHAQIAALFERHLPKILTAQKPS